MVWSADHSLTDKHSVVSHKQEPKEHNIPCNTNSLSHGKHIYQKRPLVSHNPRSFSLPHPDNYTTSDLVHAWCCSLWRPCILVAIHRRGEPLRLLFVGFWRVASSVTLCMLRMLAGQYPLAWRLLNQVPWLVCLFGSTSPAESRHTHTSQYDEPCPPFGRISIYRSRAFVVSISVAAVLLSLFFSSFFLLFRFTFYLLYLSIERKRRDWVSIKLLEKQ